MQYFITLYDQGYLSRGIALYQSLKKNCTESFRLFVLAMDDEVAHFWRENSVQEIEIIVLWDLFEIYPILKELRNERTYAEFCWTLSAFSIQYAFKKYQIPACTYLDSDIYFYDDPKKILDELTKESVLITEHNFFSGNDLTRQSGKFCVQFMYFKNNLDGNEVLEWWRSRCEECCTMDPSKGLCGDQKYLDDWESRFEGKVYNCRTMGCGVAPWNLQKYDLSIENQKYDVIDKISKVRKPIIFFHFHALLKLSENLWRMSRYQTGDDFAKILYKNYIYKLSSIEKELSKEINKILPEVDELDIVRFQPLPYCRKSKLSFEIKNTKKQDFFIITVKDKDTQETAELEILKRNIKGQWISIKKIKGAIIVSRNLHEILWYIQYSLCFSDCLDAEDALYEISRRKAAGEWMMTECPWNLLGRVQINHPAYEIRSVVRVYDKPEKDSGYTQGYYDVSSNVVVRV